jgi:hypothetical protein
VSQKSWWKFGSMSPSHPRNPEMRSKTTTMETCTWTMEQQRKRSKALNRTGPTTETPTPRNKSTGKRKGTIRRVTPTKGVSKKTNNQNKGPNGLPKEQQWRPKQSTPATLPAISEHPKRKNRRSANHHHRRVRSPRQKPEYEWESNQ